MATIGEIIFKLIQDSGDIQGDDNIYPIQIPQKIVIGSNAVCVYNVISTTPTNTKQEGSTLDRYRVQVSLFCTNYNNLYTTANGLRPNLENVINQDVTGDGTITQCSTFEGQIDGMDTFSGLQGVYYIHQDYYFWLTRTI